MKLNQTTLDKLEDILGESEYVVRYERGNFQSGWCLLEAKKIVVLNKFLNTEGRINTLLELIPQLNIEYDKLTLESQKLYESVLKQVANWGSPEQIMFVVGATKAQELENIRSIIPHHFLLVPGVGAQGGSLADVTKYGKNESVGLLVNASRAIIFASTENDFAEKASTAAEAYATEMKGLL